MNKDLTITQGDEKAYNLTFKTGEAALDITDTTVTMTLKRGLSDATTTLTKTSNHTDAINGATTLTLEAVDTDIPLGSYYYDIQIVGGSIKKKTVLKGMLTITWQATED